MIKVARPIVGSQVPGFQEAHDQDQIGVDPNTQGRVSAALVAEKAKDKIAALLAQKQLFSQTVPSTYGGYRNILAPDKASQAEINSARTMEPLIAGEKRIYSDPDVAASMAAKRAQFEYEEARRDPNSSWYNPHAVLEPRQELK